MAALTHGREDHKVHKGDGALVALIAAASLEDPETLGDVVGTPKASFASSSFFMSPELEAEAGIPIEEDHVAYNAHQSLRTIPSEDALADRSLSAPVPVPDSRGCASTRQDTAKEGRDETQSGESGSRLSSLLSLSCFSGGSMRLLGDDEDTGYCPECEVGIRPSFYWLEGPVSLEEREEAEASFKFLKADCQDEASVLYDFAGVSGLTFVGVFDGHGPNGRAAAKFASEQLPMALEQYSSALKSKYDRRKFKAMRMACKEVNQLMQDHVRCGFDASMSGTTACFALLSGGRCLVANVGDSRCVLGKSSGKSICGVPLTLDAKPDLPSEEKRISLCGGVVQQLLDEFGQRQGAYRVFRRGDDVLPGLAMSRSLGDTYAHSVGVTWEPILSSHSLGSKDLFLIFGTDGLWDVMENDEAVDFVERYRNQRHVDGLNCAEALTLEAQERWKSKHEEALVDDVSVAILHITPAPPAQNGLATGKLHSLNSLPRAATSNDEANKLSCLLRKGSNAEDPSYYSPRQFFKHLYGEENEITGSELENNYEISKLEPGTNESGELVASKESEQEKSVKSVLFGLRNSTKACEFLHSSNECCEPRDRGNNVEGLRRNSGALSAAIARASSEDLRIPSKFSQNSQAWTSQTSQDDPNNIPCSSNIVEPMPRIGRTSSGAASNDIRIPDRNQPTQSQPIPVIYQKNASASAPPTCLLGSMDDDSDRYTHDSVRPVRTVKVSSSVIEESGCPNPGNSRILSVPSWDGAFISSFTSECSLRAFGAYDGVSGPCSDETPRSPAESDSHSFDSISAHCRESTASVMIGIPIRPKRCEGRHEGKVHGGIPRSISLASTGHGSRVSSDSEKLSHLGSIDDVQHWRSYDANGNISRSLNACKNEFRSALKRSASEVPTHLMPESYRHHDPLKTCVREQARTVGIPRSQSHSGISTLVAHRGSYISSEAYSIPRVVRNVHWNINCGSVSPKIEK